MTGNKNIIHQSRLYFLDNLRTFMIFLVVVLHAGLVYECTGMAGFFWIVYDFSTNTIVNEINLFLDIFIMATLFFIAGYFVPRSSYSKSALAFLRSKLRRLMLPWLFGVLVLIPLYKVIFLASRGMAQEHWTSYFFFSNGMISQNWLWFLPVLFMFNVIFLLLSRLNLKPPNLSFFVAVLIAFVLGLSYSVSLDLLDWQGWTKNAIVNFQNERLLIYFMMFLLGALAFQKGLFESTRKINASYINALLFTWIPLLVYRYFHMNVAVNSNESILSPFIDTLILWSSFYLALAGLMIVIISAFRIFMNGHGKISRHLAANSYAVYIIHTIVLGGIAMLLLNINIVSFLKFVILMLSTFAVSNALVVFYRYVAQSILKSDAGLPLGVRPDKSYTIVS